MAGFLASLVVKGVQGIKTLVTNAKIGKQFLASGATMNTQQSGSGTNTQVMSGGTFAVPVWIWYIAGAVLIVPIFIWLISKLFKK